VFPDPAKYKISYSKEMKDCITKLLHKDPVKRLGSLDDANEILEHPLFKTIS
jgi:hypothetical protein